MIYREIKGDLFDVSEDYTLVHCISRDYKMGAGIAVEFVNRNPSMRRVLQHISPKVGEVLIYRGTEHSVFNLITKERFYHKPTREDFNNTILELRAQCLALDIKK